MQWQEQFKKLEDNKKWDAAIEYMQDVIAKNPNDMNAYIAILYLLMNLIKYEHGGIHPWWHYSALGLELFDESYPIFSNNPEYLYYVGISMGIGSSFYIETGLTQIRY